MATQYNQVLSQLKQMNVAPIPPPSQPQRQAPQSIYTKENLPPPQPYVSTKIPPPQPVSSRHNASFEKILDDTLNLSGVI